MNFTDKISYTIVYSFLVLFMPFFASAATSFSVSPLLIDHSTEGRDIIQETITLTNHQDNNARVYASVNEVVTDGEEQILQFVPGSMSDRMTAVTSWIEISRARLEIPALGKLEVPVTIKIHPNAPPGEYQAYIGFASGANRDEIENKIISGQGTGAIVKISIAEDKREQLSLVAFDTDRFIWHKNAKSQITYTLENSGDTPLIPQGEIIIYNNRGEELTTVAVNDQAQVILPGEKKNFTEPLPFLQKFSKNKAYLSIRYGNKQQATVFDTAFYYSVPWYYLVLIFFLLLCSLTVVAFVFRRAYSKSTDQYNDQIYEVPMFVKESNDHKIYDHDLNLKNEKTNK